MEGNEMYNWLYNNFEIIASVLVLVYFVLLFAIVVTAVIFDSVK